MSPFCCRTPVGVAAYVLAVCLGGGGGGAASTMHSCLLHTQKLWVKAKIWRSQEFLMLLIFIDGTAWKSGYRLNNVNRTHLVLASGKLVIQKHFMSSCTNYHNFGLVM